MQTVLAKGAELKGLREGGPDFPVPKKWNGDSGILAPLRIRPASGTCVAMPNSLQEFFIFVIGVSRGCISVVSVHWSALTGLLAVEFATSGRSWRDSMAFGAMEGAAYLAEGVCGVYTPAWAADPAGHYWS